MAQFGLHLEGRQQDAGFSVVDVLNGANGVERLVKGLKCFGPKLCHQVPSAVGGMDGDYGGMPT
ncbi:hypothetical protein D3C87_1873050 [compost metagenome]